MSDKVRFPREEALRVALELVELLRPACSRIEIAGSIRRLKPDVGDIEIVYVPRMCLAPDLFGGGALVPASDAVIERMVKAVVIGKRKNSKGSTMWGVRNKLGMHVDSGIPVDFFATEEAAWWNYLVCRTGGAENNMEIAGRAQAKGWQWNPYGPGFTRLADGEVVAVGSEAEVFRFVGMKYLKPEERT